MVDFECTYYYDYHRNSKPTLKGGLPGGRITYWRNGEYVIAHAARTNIKGAPYVLWRFNPLGGRGPDLKWYMRLPHYHRRASGGIGFHRPLETFIRWLK